MIFSLLAELRVSELVRRPTLQHLVVHTHSFNNVQRTSVRVEMVMRSLHRWARKQVSRVSSSFICTCARGLETIRAKNSQANVTLTDICLVDYPRRYLDKLVADTP